MRSSYGLSKIINKHVRPHTLQRDRCIDVAHPILERRHIDDVQKFIEWVNIQSNTAGTLFHNWETFWHTNIWIHVRLVEFLKWAYKKSFIMWVRCRFFTCSPVRIFQFPPMCVIRQQEKVLIGYEAVFYVFREECVCCSHARLQN